MGAGRRFTDEERAEIKRLYAEGGTLRGIADALDRSPGSVSRVCAELGLTFDRSQTRAATEAKQWDNRAARAALVQWQYQRMMKLARRLDGVEFKTVARTQTGVLAESLPFVPPDDELSLSRAMTTYAKTAAELEKVDASNSTADEAVSTIGRIGDALSAVARSLNESNLEDAVPEDGVGEDDVDGA